MAEQEYNIASLFQSDDLSGVKKDESKLAEVGNQLKAFTFGGKKEGSENELPPVTLILTPSTGSTCVSLYPRTKTFTLKSQLNESACVAFDENEQTWRITTSPPQSPVEARRFNFERVAGQDGAEVVEAFRRCSVSQPDAANRRRSTLDYGRKMSVGHFSGGFALPYSSS